MPIPTPNRRLSAITAIAMSAMVASLVGCSAPASEPGSTSTDSPEHVELSVFAAASLQPAFEPLAAAFSETHPEVTFTLTFDGSSLLATQLLAGASTDLFASADEANMQKVIDDDLIEGAPTVFATSELVIAVAPENPLGIATLEDLTLSTKDGAAPIVVLCAADVPCGSASHTLLERDRVALTPASEEQNVTAVLTKVQTGEADAGLVYASDVLRAAGDVDAVPIIDASDAAGSYTIGATTNAASPDTARAFIDFLQTDAAQELLKDLGFQAP